MWEQHIKERCGIPLEAVKAELGVGVTGVILIIPEMNRRKKSGGGGGRLGAGKFWAAFLLCDWQALNDAED